MWQIVLAVVFIVSWFLVRKGKKLDGLPGPKGIPFFGNAFQLDMTRPHVQMFEWMKQYGDLFYLNLAGINTLVVSGKENLYEVCVKKDKEFGGRPSNSFRLKLFCENFVEVGFSNPSPKWHALKKLQLSQIKGYGDGFQRIEKITIDTLEEMLDGLGDVDGKVIRFDELLKEVLVKITYIVIFGEKMQSEQELAEINEVSWSIVPILESGGAAEWLDMFPWLRFFGNSTWKNLQEMRRKRRKLYEQWKERALMKAKRGEDMSTNLLYRVLEEINGENPHGITEDSALMMPWQLFFGGVLTTQSNLCTFFNLMTQFPEIQKKLQAESDAVLGGKRVKFSDRSSMPYHYATVLELTRYVTPIPLGVPHMTLADTSIGATPVPAGTLVWPNLWGHNHREDGGIWGADPWTFRPERYLEEDPAESGDAAPCVVPADHATRVNNLAFGAGLRVCPGETFAITRMFVLIARVLQRFTVLPAAAGTGGGDDAVEACDPRRMKHGIVLDPPPYSVRLQRRQ